MVLTVPEQLASMSSRISSLEAAMERRLAALEARLPAPPQPHKPPEVPKWAKPFDGPNGIDYTGPPSPPELSGAGGSGPGFGTFRPDRQPGGDWRDPSGLWRSASGELTKPPSPVRGPERESAHDVAVRLSDEIVAAHGQGE
jgi:hypothetical protein